MVLIDSHSKWIDVKHMYSTNASSTIDELRLIFGEHGIPEEVVSDNGPPFQSLEFKLFIRLNGVKHVLTPPYHPASNGAAERSIRIVKEALSKQVIQGTVGKSMKQIANFLLRYRTTPHSVTGCTPAELMMKKQLRTRLSLVKPSVFETVERKQTQQKMHHDKSSSGRVLKVNDRVRVRNMAKGYGTVHDNWCHPQGMRS